MAVETGGYDFAGAGVTFADAHGRFSWGFGADNARTGRNGSIEHSTARLTMLDAAWAADFARVGLSLRNAEVPVTFKDGATNRLIRALRWPRSPAAGPAWGLRVTGRDDRLSGSEFPGIEFKRKGLLVEANGWPRPQRPVWWRASGEHDWFAVRHPGGTYSPEVSRLVGEAGARFGLEALLDEARRGEAGGRVVFDLSGSFRASDRHAPRAGGRAEIQVALPAAVKLGFGGGRLHLAPTYDQEVLVPGSPEAVPEQHDSYGVRVTRDGPFTCGFEAARREIVHQPFVSEDVGGEPWPQFRFVERRTRHWEVRAALSYEGGPLGLAAGVWGSWLFPDEDFGDAALLRDGLAPFVPAELGRAFASIRFSLFGDDLVIMPRVEILGVGARGDFAGERLPAYARLDGSR
jgi:hypothetical protein